MAINTQPISDAHDKIFDTVIAGLGSARVAAVSTATKVGSVPVLRGVSGADTVLDRGFGLLEKGLTRQHDLVEGLLARAR